MKRLGILVALLCTSNTAPLAPPVSHPIVGGPGTELFSGWPPDRFVGEAEFRMILATYERVQEICSQEGRRPVTPGWHYEGCQQGDTIVVFLPSRGDGEHFARIVAHELAHRRSWPGNHPA